MIRERARTSLGVLALVGAVTAGCARPEVRLPVEPWPEQLAEWGLFLGPLAELRSNAGVLVYDLNTALFSDYALKHRTVWMPVGRSAEAHGTGLLDLPVGTILSKTFYYHAASSGDASRVTDAAAPGAARLLIETRLLVHAPTGWVALPYVWNAEQTQARLEIAGDQRRLMSVGMGSENRAFEYVVPNTDQCASCHVTEGDGRSELRPIGPTLRNLSRRAEDGTGAGQLDQWREHGYLASWPETAPLPVWDEPASASLSDRARAYLDVQCAHCHSAGGPADTSGLYLNIEETDPLRLGMCKTPVAAGRGSGGLRYDILPGRPDASILVFRMAAFEPDVMMPELGRSLRHEEGLALVREWVESLAGECGSGAGT